MFLQEVNKELAMENPILYMFLWIVQKQKKYMFLWIALLFDFFLYVTQCYLCLLTIFHPCTTVTSAAHPLPIFSEAVRTKIVHQTYVSLAAMNWEMGRVSLAGSLTLTVPFPALQRNVVVVVPQHWSWDVCANVIWSKNW